MGLFKGLIRTVTSPVEITARTLGHFTSDEDNDDWLGVDIGTLGITRAVRSTFKGTRDTMEAITDEFEE